jgi:alcohol dehydrogenase
MANPSLKAAFAAGKFIVAPGIFDGISARVADAMGMAHDGTTDGSRAVRAVKKLLADLEFPVLADLKVTEADLDNLTELALEDYFITMAPEPWSAPEVRHCFAQALALEAR